MTEIESFLLNGPYRVVGVTGNAGAGKSTLARNLPSDKFISYGIDGRFVGDSQFRKRLLKAKAESSIHAYIDACNQFNWWDWDSVIRDVAALAGDQPVDLEAYDRDKGSFGTASLVPNGRRVICEGALLGPEAITQLLDVIVFVYTPIGVRLERLLSKDAGRRSVTEIVSRFLITEYSERLYYEHLFDSQREKMYFVNGEGTFIPCPQDVLSRESFIPLPL